MQIRYEQRLGGGEEVSQGIPVESVQAEGTAKETTLADEIKEQRKPAWIKKN